MEWQYNISRKIYFFFIIPVKEPSYYNLEAWRRAITALLTKMFKYIQFIDLICLFKNYRIYKIGNTCSNARQQHTQYLIYNPKYCSFLVIYSYELSFLIFLCILGILSSVSNITVYRWIQYLSILSLMYASYLQKNNSNFF